MKKFLAIILIASICSFPAAALSIPEGAVVKTADNPDVYIIKYMNGKSFKRLVLNPQVFESYGHLRWENILTVDQSTMNSFASSEMVRVDGQSGIYRLLPDGDNGNKILLNETGDLDTDSVYTINSVDFGNYTELPAGDDLSGPYEIYKIIDGDTLSVMIDGKAQIVRLIGMDSPEVGSPYTPEECYGEEASLIAKEKLQGKKIKLEADPASGDKDKYGRLLRYVYQTDGTLFNEWMIAEGYAKEYTYGNMEYKYQSRFRTAQHIASAAKKGLWSIEVCALSKDFFAGTDYVCSSDAYNCSSFSTQAEAQSTYSYCVNQTGKDIHNLDTDSDGIACEGLK